ncbi:MAG: gliding motility-associated C-terminal domain-containing protein [Bacteroidia bacterium]|nr:gliding motility-associated C-terminal domain-containing protein [Bacteroidia bacterium]
MNKPLYIFLFIILFCCEAKTQTNLVPNGSFEIFDTCPYNPGQVNFAKGWYLPTFGSSDYFNSCDFTNYVSTPSNSFGYQIPFHGNAYCGFGCYFISSNLREYIAVKLTRPLIQDYQYHVSFYVSLSDSSEYAINSIGAYFDKDSIYSNLGYALDTLVPQVVSKVFMTNVTGWTKVASDFIATGGEAYMILGNFKLNTNTDTLRMGQHRWDTYYFVDSVSVYEESKTPINDGEFNLPNVFTPNNDGINDNWQFNLSEEVICTIYNRWGNKIFSCKHSTINWDGKNNLGKECEDGVYFYVIQTKLKYYKGYIQLIR